MRISDWSSDVCSSDLFAAQLREHRGAVVDKGAGVLRAGFGRQNFELLAAGKVRRLLQPLQQAEGQRAEDVEADLAVGLAGPQDRKRVVEGQSVPLRVELGGRRTIQQKKSARV